MAVEDVITEGDKVAWRYTLRATHQGEFMGVPATGKVVTWTAIIISRFAGGKFVEDWENLDMLGLMQQLGAVQECSSVTPPRSGLYDDAARDERASGKGQRVHRALAEHRTAPRGIPGGTDTPVPPAASTTRLMCWT